MFSIELDIPHHMPMGDLSQFAVDNNVTFEIVKVEGKVSTVKFTARNETAYKEFIDTIKAKL